MNPKCSALVATSALVVTLPFLAFMGVRQILGVGLCQKEWQGP